MCVISITNNCTCTGFCTDVRAFSAYNLTVFNCKVTTIRVTNDCTNTIDARCINFDITANCYVFDRTRSCIAEANYCSNVITIKFTRIDRNIFNCEVLNYCIAINSTEQTVANITVSLSSCFCCVEVGQLMALTIENTIKCSVAVITDVYAPVNTGHIDICAKSYINAFCVILCFTCVNTVSECNKCFKRTDNEGIFFCTCTRKRKNFAFCCITY